DRREDLVTRQAGVLQVRRRSLADPRQGLGERDQTAVLDLVPHLAPFRVIAVLLAPAGVASRRLQMPTRVRANPDILPRRRNRQRSNPLQLGRIGDRSPVRPDIAHLLLAAETPD